ncbi:hypothetical protein ABW636_22230 [Aquimarina sp. 2201CG1-2-11]|uniref:hypothetical protein n=1 Tax=Aquimarina discodermiae TaxID=3231043 RepID=UPI0034623CFE
MDIEKLDIETLGDFYLGFEEDHPLKDPVMTELQKRIDENTNFSKEHLVQMSIVHGRALGINFIPGSESFNNYGRNITVTVSDNEDIEVLLQNYASNPPIYTYGNIRLSVLVAHNLTQEQINSLANEGIDTFHISSVLHV